MTRSAADGGRAAPAVLQELVGYHLRRASGAVSADFARALAGTAMRPVPFVVLAAVAAEPGVGPGAVGRALGVKPPNMAALVADLAGAGLLERRAAEGDRRSVALTLTGAGRARFDECLLLIREHERTMFARLSAEERAALVALLRRVG